VAQRTPGGKTESEVIECSSGGGYCSADRNSDVVAMAWLIAEYGFIASGRLWCEPCLGHGIWVELQKGRETYPALFFHFDQGSQAIKDTMIRTIEHDSDAVL